MSIQLTDIAGTQPAESNRPQLDPHQALNRMTHMCQKSAHNAVPSGVNRELNLGLLARLIKQPEAVDRHRAILELNPRHKDSAKVAGDPAGDHRAVDLGHLKTRVGEPVG